MPVTKEDVEKVATLARLEFSEQEKEELVAQLNRILEYMEKLNELDTTDIEPTTHVVPLKNVFREDIVQPSLPRKKVFANAPAHEDGFFKVPRVID